MTKRFSLPSYLDSSCRDFPLCNGLCGNAIKLNRETGRYFITIGHPGFNSKANNGFGYASYKVAYSELLRYARPKAA